MSRTTNFALLFVGVIVIFAGATVWIATLDHDHKYFYETAHDEWPRYAEGDLAYYEDLSDEDRRIVDGARNGTAYRFEERAPVPPEVIKKDGTYYEFEHNRIIDWGKPATAGSTLLSATGAAIALFAIRRDIHENPP